MNRNYDVIIFILDLKCPFLLKIVTMFIKTSLKIQKMLKEVEIMYRNASYICLSRYIKFCRFLLLMLK